MQSNYLVSRLQGIHTLKSIMSELSVSRQKAIYLVYRLRKEGYVKTKRSSEGIRLYSISIENKLKGISYYDILNKYSPIKVAKVAEYKVYGKVPTLEETLIFAIKTRSLRVILSSLALFSRINDWSELNRLAKKNHIKREVGALYDLARIIIRTRRMPKRFRTNALPKKDDDFKYLVAGLKSNEFNNIEKTWRVYLPFNKKDLEDYK